MATILELYKEIAAFIGVKFDENGAMSQSYDGEKITVTVGGKVVHLPDNAFLKAPDWDHNIAFHPLSEQSFRGESEIMQQLRKLLVFRLNHTVSRMAELLMDLAADPSQHRKLGAKASAYLSLIPKADDKSVKALSDILDKLGSSNQRWLLGMYLKRPGKIGDQQFSRVAVFRYPILTEYSDANRTIFDVKLRVDDYKGFRDFFKFLLGIPADGNYEVHNFGTNEETAPYLTAVLGGGLKFAKHLNVLLKLFQKAIPEFSELMFDTSWETMIDDFERLSRELPPLEGNRGVQSMGGEDEATAVTEAVPGKRKADRSQMLRNGLSDNIQLADTAPVTAHEQPVAAPVAQPTVQQPAISRNDSGESISWDELNRKRMAAQPQVPMMPMMAAPQMMPGYAYQQPVGNPGFARQPQPQMMPMMPMQPQMMPMMPQAMPGYPQQQMMPGYPQQPTQTNTVLSAFAQAGGMGYPQQQQMMPSYPQPQQMMVGGYPQQQQMMPGYGFQPTTTYSGV